MTFLDYPKDLDFECLDPYPDSNPEGPQRLRV